MGPFRTYTFYFVRDGQGLQDSRFEPVLCRDDAQAFAAAHEAALKATDCDYVLVCFGDDELFRAGVARS